MTQNSSPDWSALPHNPIQFFELESGFDRKDLKRSYNRLIKKFKPEKFPAEFQRIRSAYEQLEQQLRYGHQPQQMDLSDLREQSLSLGPIPMSSVSSTQAPDQPTVVWEERLEELGPEKLLEELRAKTPKTPYDYYCLAVVEDAFAKPDQLKIARVLLKGLSESPDNFPLKRCLNQFYRIDFPIKTIGALLIATAKALPNQSFYFVTEPLWDQLIRKVSFSKFKKLYADCETEIRDHQIQQQLIFLLHILKPAMWLGEKKWVEQQFRVLEDHGQELPPHAEYDYDTLNFLREYHQSRPDENMPGSLRSQIEDVIKAYCVEPERETERKFLELQVRIANDSEELVREFPINSQEGNGELLRVLWFLNGEISERLHLRESEPRSGSEKQIRVSVRQFLLGLDVMASRRWPGQIYFSAGLLYLFGLAMFLLIPCIVFGVIASFFDPSGEVFVGVIIAGAAAGFGLQKTVFPLIWRPFIQRMRDRIYRQTWRPETLMFLRQGFVSLDQLIQTIPAVANDEMTSAGWIYEYAQYDAGLVLYSWAQDYVA